MKRSAPTQVVPSGRPKPHAVEVRGVLHVDHLEDPR